MTRMLVLVILTVIAGYAATALAVPQQIAYQGYLTRPNGAPLDTTVAMTFRLWNPEGTISFWAEYHPSVTVNGGIFSVRLGESVPITEGMLAHPSATLGVAIGGDAEMSPRILLSSVMYSRRVGAVDGAGGGSVTGKLTVGWDNSSNTDTAFVFGLSNHATADHAVISGGRLNTASGHVSTIGGGNANVASGSNSAVLGGSSNTAGIGSAVGGGVGNDATGTYSSVPGGFSNAATGFASFAVGSHNTASGSYSFAAGGAYTSPNANTASGNYSCAIGTNIDVAGINSFGLGTSITCAAESAFVWSDGSGPVLSIGMSRSFNVKATRGTRIWTSPDISAGVTIGAGGNSWIGVSDSTKKRNIRGLDTQDILARFASLPLKRWEYKSEDAGVEHIGPMAQDFWNAFHLGNEPLGISTIDADGVMMAAIQELAKQVAELRAENAAQQRQIQSLLAKDEHTQRKNGE